MIHVGDGTWNLRVFITDLQVEKTLRVKGDLHIGGVMLRLVDPGEFHRAKKDLYILFPRRTIPFPSYLFTTYTQMYSAQIHDKTIYGYLKNVTAAPGLNTHREMQKNTREIYGGLSRANMYKSQNSLPFFLSLPLYCMFS